MLAAGALVGSAAGASAMTAESSPEHVAAGLAALKAHHADTARRELRAALSASGEPAGARAHARAALAALAADKLPQAQTHAADGAAVEHLTYALGALRAHHPAEAAGHLQEAAELRHVRSAARRALADIAAHHTAAAIRAVRAGLKRAG